MELIEHPKKEESKEQSARSFSSVSKSIKRPLA
jgi:hypothetical protein